MAYLRVVSIGCLYLFDFLCFLPIAMSDQTETDRHALLCFKSQLSGPTVVLASWSNASLEHCNWHGVTCSMRVPRRVIAIDLPSEGIIGPISPCIANITSLTRLQLSNNSFHGGIPSELGLLNQLRNLNLSRNSLEGNIPSELSSCSQLQILDLQSNSLQGEIPPSLSQCVHLERIFLANNKLQGRIPSAFGDLPKLRVLFLANNRLSDGSIPESLGHIPTLEELNLNLNNFSGAVPPSLFNMSSLTSLVAANNSLTGRLPLDIGYTLPNIEGLILSANKFKGSIPTSLLNLTHLQMLYLADNKLTGIMPSFGSLTNLEDLDVAYNMLEAGDWGFISSLSNCTRLTKLMLDGNNLQGNLPSSVGNLSSDLQRLWLTNNKISGPIPQEIGNLKSLTELYMDYNQLSEKIPLTIGNLRKLGKLSFARNRLSGQIPDDIGKLVQLNNLNLDWNNLSGSIPVSIGYCTQLEILNLAHNSLDGTIPETIFKISSLSIVLDLSYNYLSGSISDEVGNLVSLNKLIISYNRLSGDIPSTLSQCVVLEYLEMQSNFFVGSIPQTFVNMVGIKVMDISHNNLSGEIPQFLTLLHSLQVLNLSFNNFDGAVPTSGIFANASVVSIEGNDYLCTKTPMRGVPLCSKSVDKKRNHRSLVLVLTTVIPIVAITFTLLCLAKYIWTKRMQAEPHVQQLNEHRNITYEDVLKATNRFSSTNLLGSGSFGTVYKGNLHLPFKEKDNLHLQEEHIAIKIFNLDIHGSNKSFVAECETLQNVRHRNLVKIITLCSSVDSTGADFKAIVFPYFPNGNLDMWLHPKSHEHISQTKVLTLRQRINIALDVALALDYLHNQCELPLVHCDLKPSNILLDSDMVAHVSDFGLARFVYTRSNAHQYTSTSLACLKGSIGYIPPEYGMSKDISTKGDVYSFGILLLEMVTGSSPIDEKFNGGTTLHEFVDAALSNSIHEVVDPTMLQDDVSVADGKIRPIKSRVERGCTQIDLPQPNPAQNPTINQSERRVNEHVPPSRGSPSCRDGPLPSQSQAPPAFCRRLDLGNPSTRLALRR
ncbi:Os06g0587500 [Oryza sativa Japonica Group]|uniref:Receptor kinase-like protein Xa21 n=1 Tax=Oryza sativa subsp. japonica TaxID=39947 RepID=Q0DBA2_ORYSJ|nr:Os06g0587500 [Oryza sativa Japonica Group]|eukprot:NP_001057957.2 Os06g0587500 [Oryza sativa Japonica Group]